MDALIVALAPFLLNGVMAGVKWFAGNNTFSTVGKRGILALLAIVGAVAYGSLTGSPVDMNSVTSLATTVIEAFVAFLLAHGSYTLFWKSK